MKRQLGLLPIDILERGLALSVLANKYGGLERLKEFTDRELLWSEVFRPHANKAVTVLEFGVFKGRSIAEFSMMNTHPQSRFFGFDSFRGLPERWFPTMEKGMFDTRGETPEVPDSRVKFVKGWFQNTLPKFLAETEITGELIVHYDADLYSATLFVLSQLDPLKRRYDAIFDEFTGHETRALYNYQQMTGAGVEFTGKTTDYGFPHQVSCVITPCSEFTV